MSQIHKEALQKAALIVLIGGFARGVFGEVRLQKVAYFAQKKFPYPFFSYRKHWHGQYSEQLKKLLEDLSAAKALEVEDYNNQCVFYQVGSKDLLQTASEILGKIAPESLKAISEAISEYGYLKEPELLEIAYEIPEMQKAKFEDILVEEHLSEKEFIDLDEDLIEDFELSLDPRFVQPLNTLAKGLKSAKLSSEMEKLIFDES